MMTLGKRVFKRAQRHAMNTIQLSSSCPSLFYHSKDGNCDASDHERLDHACIQLHVHVQRLRPTIIMVSLA